MSNDKNQKMIKIRNSSKAINAKDIPVELE